MKHRALQTLAVLALLAACGGDTIRHHSGADVSISSGWLARFWRSRGYQGSCLPGPTLRPNVTMYAPHAAEREIVRAIVRGNETALAAHDRGKVCFWRQMLAHELTHAEQLHKMTPPIFLDVYLVEVVWAGLQGNGPRNIPLEETARRRALEERDRCWAGGTL